MTAILEASGGPRRVAAVLAASLAFVLALPAPSSAAPRAGHAKRHQAQPHHAGHRQVGWASHYGHGLAGRRMADGTRLRPDSDTAASKTLPLGTTARVVNLRNGRSAVVTIRDRGPHVKGRIIDVSPGVARRLGMTDSGVARVEVVTLRLPAAPAAARRRHQPGNV